MPVTPTDLYRRLSERIERQKPITLSPEELDLFVIMGGFDAVSKYAADWMRTLAKDRNAVAEAEHADALDEAYRAQHPQPHPDPEVEAACRRAWEMCQPKKRRPRVVPSTGSVEASARRARSRTKPHGSST